MINLVNPGNNVNIILYINTLDPDLPYNSNLFLFGFKNGFSNKWTYVMPVVEQQNARYVRFSINLVQQQAMVDAFSASIQLSPSGNWDYRLWSIESATLDPASGYLLDEGQMYLENTQPESVDVVYISDNDPERNVIYLTRDDSQCATWASTDIWKFSTFTWNCNMDLTCDEWQEITADWETITATWDACELQ